MDLMMPIMGGIEACKHIRHAEQTAGVSHYIPIIALSGNGRKDIVETVMQDGMQDFILKPYNKDKLLMLITQWTC